MTNIGKNIRTLRTANKITVTQAFILLFKAAPLQLSYAAFLRRFTIGLFAAYLIMVCPYTIKAVGAFFQSLYLHGQLQSGKIKEYTVINSYSFLPVWDFIALKVLYALTIWKLYALFVIPGAVLQLTKKKKAD